MNEFFTPDWKDQTADFPIWKSSRVGPMTQFPEPAAINIVNRDVPDVETIRARFASWMCWS